MGNGSPNFQKKYMKVNHTIQAKRSLCLCTTHTNKKTVRTVKTVPILYFYSSRVTALTQAYVADNEVTDVERHHKDENQQDHMQIQLPVEISGAVVKTRG